MDWIEVKVHTTTAASEAVGEAMIRCGAEGTMVEQPAAVMSTAEAVSVYFQTLCHAWYYGSGTMELPVLTENLLGAVCKENRDDLEKLKGYFNTAVKKKSQGGGLWKEFYKTAGLLR